MCNYLSKRIHYCGVKQNAPNTKTTSLDPVPMTASSQPQGRPILTSHTATMTGRSDICDITPDISSERSKLQMPLAKKQQL